MRKLYLRVICTYLIICLIPVLIMVVSYQYVNRIAQTQAEELSKSLLDRAANTISQALDSVDDLISTLALDSRVTRMVASAPIESDTSTYMRMFDARQALLHTHFSHDSLIEMMLYCEKSGVIISSSHIYLSDDRYYDVFYHYGDMDLDAWQHEVLGDFSQRHYFPARETRLRTGTGTFEVIQDQALLNSRMVFSGSSRGRIIASVSMSALSNLLEPIVKAYHGAVLIYSQTGELMVSFGASADTVADALARGEASVPGALLMQTTAPNDWRFVAALDRNDVYAGPNSMRRITGVIILLELALLVILSIIFARRSVKPVSELISLVDGTIQDVDAEADGYDYLRRAIIMINRNWMQTSAMLGKQSKELENSLLVSLLRGEQPESVLQSAFERAKVAWPDPNCSVALLSWPGADADIRGDLARVMAEDYLSRQAPKGWRYARMDEMNFGLLFPAGMDRASIEAALDAFFTALSAAECPLPRISVCPARDQRPVSRLYNIAEIRVHRWDADPGEIDWVDNDARIIMNAPHYSISVESRIIHAVKTGAVGELEALLAQLCNTIVPEKGRSGVRRELSAALRLTCARIQQEVQFSLSSGEKDEVNVRPDAAVGGEEPLEDFCRWCVNAARQIERQRGKTGHSAIIGKVCAYLEANYADKQLCLCAVAERFGFSETYFSRLFKAQTGTTYSEYLERLRVKRACELLLAGESVDRVADSTGYNSVTVFRAAFKRICGVTPSEYRQRAGGDGA